jgi:hypothetical protein
LANAGATGHDAYIDALDGVLVVRFIGYFNRLIIKKKRRFDSVRIDAPINSISMSEA